MADIDQNLRPRKQQNTENEDKSTIHDKNNASDIDSTNVGKTKSPFEQPGLSGVNSSMAYTSALEYNKAVQQWVWQYHMYTNMMWMHSMMPLMFSNTVSANRVANTTVTGPASNQTPNIQNQLASQVTGRQQNNQGT